MKEVVLVYLNQLFEEHPALDKDWIAKTIRETEKENEKREEYLKK